jgi:transposase-like protein
MNATAQMSKTCIKKNFTTEHAATDFAAQLLIDHPDQEPQYPYVCEECNFYHLSTQTKESHGLQRNGRLDAAMKVAAAFNSERKGRGFRRYPEALKLEAFRLRDQGLSQAEIADKLDVGKAYGGVTISGWLKEPELQAKHAATKTPTTVEQFESEEEKLERQLKEIRAKKQAAIEAKKWKFLPCWDGKGVLFKKEQNQMGITIADAEELIVALDDYLKAKVTVR